jgi:hypothetical protein
MQTEYNRASAFFGTLTPAGYLRIQSALTPSENLCAIFVGQNNTLYCSIACINTIPKR